MIHNRGGGGGTPSYPLLSCTFFHTTLHILPHICVQDLQNKNWRSCFGPVQCNEMNFRVRFVSRWLRPPHCASPNAPLLPRQHRTLKQYPEAQAPDHTTGMAKVQAHRGLWRLRAIVRKRTIRTVRGAVHRPGPVPSSMALGAGRKRGFVAVHCRDMSPAHQRHRGLGETPA